MGCSSYLFFSRQFALSEYLLLLVLLTYFLLASLKSRSYLGSEYNYLPRALRYFLAIPATSSKFSGDFSRRWIPRSRGQALIIYSLIKRSMMPFYESSAGDSSTHRLKYPYNLAMNYSGLSFFSARLFRNFYLNPSSVKSYR